MAMSDPVAQKWDRLRHLTDKWSYLTVWQKIVYSLHEIEDATGTETRRRNEKEDAINKAKEAANIKTKVSTRHTDADEILTIKIQDAPLDGRIAPPPPSPPPRPPSFSFPPVSLPSFIAPEKIERRSVSIAKLDEEIATALEKKHLAEADYQPLRQELVDIKNLVTALMPTSLGKLPYQIAEKEIQYDCKNFTILAKEMRSLHGEVLAVMEREGEDEKPRNGKLRRHKRKPGAPVTTDEIADKRLCDDWQVAKALGSTRESFARDRGITLEALIAAQNRVKYRRVRDAE